MQDSRADAIDTLLRLRGPQTAQALAHALTLSQPTISRALAAMGDDVARIGRARATRYARTRDIARAGSRWPLYRIDAQGRPQTLGDLTALHADGMLFTAARPAPTLLHDNFRDGHFPGVPWFLDDQRPQGFLGRQFAHRIGAQIDAPPDPLLWRADDVLLALLRYGDDQPGDLVLGDASLQRALQDALTPDTLAAASRETRYPALADSALRGDIVGSSAGGEQPKFALTLDDAGTLRPVIVKFSERTDTAAGQRWADLIVCEHLAGVVLREHGQEAAHSSTVSAGGRMFLESTRFDRTALLGRRGFISMTALDAAFYGHARIEWWRFADELERDGWLDAADAQRLRVLGWFGGLIANSDMHFGNVGFILADTRPLALAPAYDMLPMAFRPAGNGEVVARDYSVMLPTPQQRDTWHIAAGIALEFWRAASTHPQISDAFRSIAQGAAGALQQAMQRVG